MKRRRLTLAISLALAAAALASASLAARGPSSGEFAQRRSRATQTRRRAPARAQRPRVDYSKFSHVTAQHRKDCASCHTSPTENWAQARDKDSAFPDITDYPEHASCLNCHRRQFFSGARPAICTVCHTQVSPRSGARFPFENPSETFAKSAKANGRRSEFLINFPHGVHQDVMARVVPSLESPRGNASVSFVRAAYAPRAAAAEKRVDSCSICHQTYQPAGDGPDEYVTKPPAELPTNALNLEAFWLKRGMMKTAPASHASCFNCHWQDGGERPYSTECGKCHELRPIVVGVRYSEEPRADADTSNPSVKGITDADVLARWSVREVARFRHEKDDHVNKVGCTGCHVSITAAGKETAEAALVPIKTCASSSCHGSTNKSGGAKRIIFDEIEKRKSDPTYQCAKCHINLGKEPTPKSHTDLFAK